MEEIDVTKKWEKMSTRKTPIHRYFDFAESAATGLKKLMDADIPQSVLISKGGEVTMYTTKERQESLFQMMAKRFKDNAFIESVLPKLPKEQELLVEWIKTSCSLKKIENLSNTQLSDLVLKRHEKHIEICAWQWLGFAGKLCIDGVVAEKLKIYDLPIEKNLQTIYAHDYPAYVVLAEMDLKQIALKAQKGGVEEKIDSLVERYLKKYNFINMYDELYSPSTKEEITKRLKVYSKDKKLEEEIESSLNTFKQNANSFKEFILNTRFSKEDRTFFEFAHQFALFHETRNFSKGASAFYSKPFFNEIAKRLKLDLQDLLAFNDYEIADALSGIKELTMAEGKNRREFCLGFYSQEKWFFDSGKRAHEIAEIITKIEKVSELKGVVAYKGGIVKGKVKLINSVTQMGKLERGDILVSSMTRPEFITSMEKAGAIITDEGGTLCHAAIVARELKKPSIIGTKIATQILKDGDLVEVDTDRGIIRKL
ncbi:MAG: PEP-utilizing enzyme [Candidatus Pacebacteria bacterium]|nr:PEP-utilizing enzyme [Candidatus Paceibacterota bacterium]